MSGQFHGHRPYSLSPNDRRLLDDLVERGFDRSGPHDASPAEAERIGRLESLFGLLNDYPVEDGDDETLLHATLARIDREEDRRRERMSTESRTGHGLGRTFAGTGLRLPDFISVAAAILIAASILWPLLSTMRQRSIDMACANNLRLVGYAFGNYAADNNGAMPTAIASLSGASWDRVENVRVNLGPLLMGQYCSHGHLNCPGNHDNLKRTYSYQWQRPGARFAWGTDRITVVLGDRNPIIDAARAGVFLPPGSLSPDHRGRGQNVLATDGATLWLDDPVVSHNDNIWLPHGVTELHPGAQPQTKRDVFLAH